MREPGQPLPIHTMLKDLSDTGGKTALRIVSATGHNQVEFGTENAGVRSCRARQPGWRRLRQGVWSSVTACDPRAGRFRSPNYNTNHSRAGLLALFSLRMVLRRRTPIPSSMGVPVGHIQQVSSDAIAACIMYFACMQQWVIVSSERKPNFTPSETRAGVPFWLVR